MHDNARLAAGQPADVVAGIASAGLQVVEQLADFVRFVQVDRVGLSLHGIADPLIPEGRPLLPLHPLFEARRRGTRSHIHVDVAIVCITARVVVETHAAQAIGAAVAVDGNRVLHPLPAFLCPTFTPGRMDVRRRTVDVLAVPRRAVSLPGKIVVVRYRPVPGVNRYRAPKELRAQLFQGVCQLRMNPSRIARL